MRGCVRSMQPVYAVCAPESIVRIQGVQGMCCLRVFRSWLTRQARAVASSSSHCPCWRPSHGGSSSCYPAQRQCHWWVYRSAHVLRRSTCHILRVRLCTIGVCVPVFPSQVYMLSTCHALLRGQLSAHLASQKQALESYASKANGGV